MTDGVRKLDNGSGNARYVGPDGRRYSRTFRMKRDATTWRGQELRLIDLDDWAPPAARKPARSVDGHTVAEWTEQCIAARTNRSRRPIKPTTADNYRKLARLAINTSRLGAMPLKEVTRDDLAAWREALPTTTRTQNGPSTRSGSGRLLNPSADPMI